MAHVFCSAHVNRHRDGVLGQRTDLAERFVHALGVGVGNNYFSAGFGQRGRWVAPAPVTSACDNNNFVLHGFSSQEYSNEFCFFPKPSTPTLHYSNLLARCPIGVMEYWSNG